MASAHPFVEFLETLPPVDYAIAYGSAAFPQKGRPAAVQALGSMVDYMLAVEAPEEWHQNNMDRNARHYRSSWVVNGGGKRAVWIADTIGAGVHFNPFVRDQRGKAVKYGVLSLDSLLHDLDTWHRLYVSGRMHKPVLELVSHPEVGPHQRRNLRAALAATLLRLPSLFSEERLFSELCGLSYRGDIRTLLRAEDVNKVKSIVQGNLGAFQTLYREPLEELEERGVVRTRAGGHGQPRHIHQARGADHHVGLLHALPLGLLRECHNKLLTKARQRPAVLGSKGDLVRALVPFVQKGVFQPVLEGVLRRRVLTSSVKQACASFATAGVAQSMSYVGRKLKIYAESRT